jgi:hypothetical protein
MNGIDVEMEYFFLAICIVMSLGSMAYAVLSLKSGKIYTQAGVVFRDRNPKLFYLSFSILVLFSMLALSFIFT